MRRAATFILSGLLGLLLVSCGGEGPRGKASTQTDDTFAKVQRTGVLRVGYFTLEPVLMLDPGAQKPHGLFVDLIEDAAREMKWKVEYVQVDLKNFAAGLEAGQFDLSIGPTFSSPGRAGGVGFTQPLFYMGYTGITTLARAREIQSWADIDRPGVRVAVKQGSAIADYARGHFKQAKIISVEAPGLNAPLAAVPAQADIGLMNQLTVFTYLRDTKSTGPGGAKLTEVLANDPKEFTGICWAVRPNDVRWLAFVNTCIKHEFDTGRFDEYAPAYDVPYLYRPVATYTYRLKGTEAREIRR
jgi:polar amino acid transport system substrate-binding protein